MSEKYSVVLHSQNKQGAKLPYGKNYKVSYTKFPFKLSILKEDSKDDFYSVDNESSYENNSFIINSNKYQEHDGYIIVHLKTNDDIALEVKIEEI